MAIACGCLGCSEPASRPTRQCCWVVGLAYMEVIFLTNVFFSYRRPLYSVSQKISPCGLWLFRHFLQTFENFKSIFTHLLYVPIYARLQIVTQLSPTLTKLCHIKHDYLHDLDLSRSRVVIGHVTISFPFPIDALLSASQYLQPFLRYWTSNIFGPRPWRFWVTWRHRSRDHWTRDVSFPIGGPLDPSLYL